MTRTPERNAPGNGRSQTDPRSGQQTVSVVLYSDDVDTRASVMLAVGRRPAPDVPVVEWTECATAPALLDAVRQGGHDLLVLDGEARPAGGMGMCRQLKDEIRDCPPVLLLTGRPDDAWLATWSMADHVVPRPLDPMVLADAVADMIRKALDAGNRQATDVTDAAEAGAR